MCLKLFSKNKKSEFADADLPRICRFCESAKQINDDENVLCSERGIVFAEYHCRKFSYDPLKREPKMPPPMPKPNPNDPDFALPAFLTGEPAASSSEHNENSQAVCSGENNTSVFEAEGNEAKPGKPRGEDVENADLPDLSN